MTDDTAKRLSIKDVAERLDRVVDSTNSVLDGITEKLDRITRALDRPVVTETHKEFDVASAPMGQHGTAHFTDSGALVKPRLTDVNAPEFKAKEDNTAFGKEMVLIHVHETSEREAAQTFEVSVNGEKWVFKRGDKRLVPRYIVERLALARPVHYRSEKFTTSQGVEEYRYPSHRGLRFPFSVLEDTDRGKAWLARVSQAA